MNKNLLIGLIIVVLLGAVGWWLMSGKKNTGTGGATSGNTCTTEVSDAVVTFTDAGFQPSRLDAQKGKPVTFKNDSSGSVWVASDPHPVHTDLPGFDEKTGMAKGCNWQFTFTSSGSHPYHDHLDPGKTGVIVVQ